MNLFITYWSGVIATAIASRLIWGKSQDNGERAMRAMVSIFFSWFGFVFVCWAGYMERKEKE